MLFSPLPYHTLCVNRVRGDVGKTNIVAGYLVLYTADVSRLFLIKIKQYPLEINQKSDFLSSWLFHFEEFLQPEEVKDFSR